ncbi:MAG: class I tRNA ligase family protein, partial [Myxococcota bacterium]|nr:class I tRNA ligase family protein [Myxococcota bacterium]
MSEEFPKHFAFAEIEARTSQRWLDANAFAAAGRDGDDTYVIMMPLPNVTGALHMGHAMDNVMQDFLIRWHRMRGENTLWQPGTDHAGIATQAVVEKRLLEFEGKTRHDIGREALVQRIWDWKDQYQARIIAQQQRMGCSADWDRQRFTMDSVCTAAVRETFFRLFRDDLIYRGNRLVNWDCHLQTAVSDDEIVTIDVKGHFWFIRYPVIDPLPGEPTHVVVATTRPETMLGDTAVACHPDPAGELGRQIERARERVAESGAKERPDLEAELERLEERERTVLPRLVALRDMALDGRHVTLPLQERAIPLILDDWAKPGLGTGCVKITPGHDPNDYDVWTRHQDEIEAVNILQPDGTLNANAGAYAGQERFEARDAVVADLQAGGLIERIEDREIPIGHSDRSKTPIEPYLSQQWFVRMSDVDGGLVMGRGTPHEFRTPGLAQAAMDAVDGSWTTDTGKRLEFHPDPERYAATYLAWLREKRDWCISRQLWWGHRIPIWSASLDAAAVGQLADALAPAAADVELRVVTPDERILDGEAARGL